jgi:preprotein translocase subunit SecA
MLVGTVSIEKSEALSTLFKKHKIPHNVLNARYHEQEAHIIAQAGRPGTVTIATNMAGRGTDIQLGGNLEMRLRTDLALITDPAERDARAGAVRQEISGAHEEVVEAGGLFVVGSERHESRRIDNQLRGRSGRQGDPGASKFFVSLEDDLMRIFGSERMDSMLQRLGLKEGEAIIHPWVNKALAKAQQKVEARNYDIRKQLLKFDDVMNDQRKVVYEQRREIMSARDVASTIADMRGETIEEMVGHAIPENSLAEQWDVQGLHAECLRLLAVDLPFAEWAKEEGITADEIRDRVTAAADRKMAEKSANYGPDLMRMAEKSLLLQLLDQTWKDHLLSLDHLRQGINLRAYAQRDPLNEYKREAFELFEAMLANLRQNVTSVLSHVELRVQPQPVFAMAGGEPEEAMADEARATGTTGRPAGLSPRAQRRAGPGNGADRGGPRPAAPRSPWAGTPRNAPCPCGSGKKFKHCHGRV